MVGNVLTGTVEIGGVRHGVTAPSAKRMMDRRTETGYFGSDRYIAYPTSAKTFLQHLAQIAGQDVGLNERIAEIGNAYRTV